MAFSLDVIISVGYRNHRPGVISYLLEGVPRPGQNSNQFVEQLKFLSQLKVA
jgi:hypothetical protein